MSRRGGALALALAALAVLQASALADQTVTLAWDPSPDPEIAGYNVYYGSASGAYTNHVSVGNVTNATISGLLKGGTYFFVVTSYNTSGLESDPSNEISYAVPLLAGRTTLQINQSPGQTGTQTSILIRGLAGQTCRLEYSDTPISTNWSPLAILTLTNNPTLFTDPSPSSPTRFYRTVLIP
jgi:hypothetical protein